jgi:hypothetical protein
VRQVKKIAVLLTMAGSFHRTPFDGLTMPISRRVGHIAWHLALLDAAKICPIRGFAGGRKGARTAQLLKPSCRGPGWGVLAVPHGSRLTGVVAAVVAGCPMWEV